MENNEKCDGMCEKCLDASAVMLDGEISKYLDNLQGVAPGCTLSCNLFKVHINDMIEEVEAAKRIGVYDGGRYDIGLNVCR